MQFLSMQEDRAERIHARALEISTRYRRTEVELIEVLDEVDRERVFAQRGYATLFQYVIRDLRLSESVAYSLIQIMRKSREVPALRTRIASGQIVLSNARRVAVVLTAENQEEWLEKAATLSNRKLEREIATVRPQILTPERVTYVTRDRVRLEVGFSEEDLLRLRRAQDLLCQSEKRAVGLEETIVIVVGEYLRRHDPVEKAKRRNPVGIVSELGITPSSEMGITSGVGMVLESENPQISAASVEANPEIDSKASRKPSSALVALPKSMLPKPKRRAPIPAGIRHQVNLRDQGRCTATRDDGSRCDQSRWIEIHHRVPLVDGGFDTVDNLTTLCSGHHRLVHESTGS